MTPPVYPRVPHLAPGPGITRDDLVLAAVARRRLLAGSVRIEEKLDGANISFSINAHRELEVATRGGVGTQDRGGHIGRARRWASEHSDELQALLADGGTLYGEWLLTRHGVRYGRLPDWFVGFDILDSSGSWASPSERDERLRDLGIATPPALGDLDAIDLTTVDALIGASELGASSVEGVIVRSFEPCGDMPRLAKRLSRNAPRVTDDAFGRYREHNHLASQAPAA